MKMSTNQNRNNLAKKIMEKEKEVYDILNEYRKIDPELFAVVEKQINEIINRAKQLQGDTTATFPPLKLTYGGLLVKTFDSKEDIKKMASLYALFYLGSCL